MVHDGADPLSQSLPTWTLKSMKSSEVKCVYDSRLFKNEESAAAPIGPKSTPKNEKFKEFLNASFTSTIKMVDEKPKVLLKQLQGFSRSPKPGHRQ